MSPFTTRGDRSMLTYTVVAAKPGRRIPAPVLDLLARADDTELSFEADEHLFWLDNTGTVAFGGWQSATAALDIGSHWHVGDAGLTAFSGITWPAAGWTNGTPWATQLADHLARRRGAVDALRGIFTSVSIAPDGRGSIVSDPLGVSIVYQAETTEVSVLSSRASMAARAVADPGHEPRRDPLGVAWLAFCGYIVGNRTGYSDVRTIPAGASVALDPHHGIHIDTPEDPPWTVDEPPGDAAELVQSFDDDLAATLRTAVALPARRRRVELTGGKDSRLVLAVLLSEGLAHGLTFRTMGGANLPDVEVAADLARAFGLLHETARGRAVPLDFEDQLRIHVFRTSGMLGASDLRGAPISEAPDSTISGVGGEILSTNYPWFPLVRSIDELVQRFRVGMRFDHLRLLRPEIRAQLEEEATTELLAEPAGDPTPRDLLDVFYAKHRLRRWFGTGHEVDRAGRLGPLYSSVALRTAFGIGTQQRRNERIHLTIMRRRCSALAKRPFANGHWRGDAVANLPDASEYHIAPPPTPTPEPRTTVAQRMSASRLTRHHAVFSKYLAAAPDHPVFDVIDRDAAVAALSDPSRVGPMERIQLFGAVTAAIWLDRQEMQFRGTIDVGEP